MNNPTNQIITVLLFTAILQIGCSSTRYNNESSENSTVVTELVKSSRSWNGELLPAYLQGQPEITVLRIKIPAGARLDTHLHPIINAGVLISGQLTIVTTDGKSFQLKAGDTIVEVVNTLHHGVNQGDVPAEIIVFYAGIVDSPVTITNPK